MKTCTKCDESKPLDHFYKSKRGLYGHRSWCKICDRDQHKEWVSLNPVKVAAIDKRYAQANPNKCASKKKRWNDKYPEKVNARRLKKRYGLSMDQYRSLFTIQNDSCALV